MEGGSKYTIELVNPAGTLLAEMTGRARSRKIELVRNYPESIEWLIDIDEFHRYCRNIATDPRSILINGITEARVRRRQSYLAGGKIFYFEPNATQDGGTITIRATGFLNLFQDRYTGTSPAGTVQELWEATDRSFIAAGLITQSQDKDNGDLGVTIGNLALVGSHDKTYSRTNIKDAIQAFSSLETDSFDFEFTHDKVFNTYAVMGSYRPDIIFEYPGNIISARVPYDSTGVANEIIGLGQGTGELAQVVRYASDTASQLNYGLRERVIQSNATDDSQGGLTDAVNAELAIRKDPLVIPELVVDGNRAPYVTDYKLGDRVIVKINNYPLVEDVNGIYRIDKISIQIDDDDNEQVTLGVTPT